MKATVGALALLLAAVAAHAQEGWISVATSQNGETSYDARKGTFEVRLNQSNEEIAVITGKSVRGKANPEINLEKWYVRTKDCAAKQGKVVTLTMDGQFKFDNDFIFDAGSMASGKAEFICEVLDHFNAERRKKSL